MAEQKTEWAVYYGGRLLDKTRAVSAEKAINNVRWNRFLSRGAWADWYDFEARKVREVNNYGSIRQTTKGSEQPESAEKPSEQVRWVQLSFL